MSSIKFLEIKEHKSSINIDVERESDANTNYSFYNEASINEDLDSTQLSVLNISFQEHLDISVRETNSGLKSIKEPSGNSPSINSQTLMNQHSSSLEYFQYDFIETNQNISSNYDYYVSKSIKSIKGFKQLESLFLKEVLKRTIDLETTKKKTLILDLDETLVHCEFNSVRSKIPSKIVSFYDEDIDEHVQVSVILRPGVLDFLREAKKYFQIGLFTASVKSYADSVLSVLDPANDLFDFRLYRESCIKVGRAYVKDLRILNKEMKDLILVDNSLYSFANQLSNGILISSFYDEPADNELENILSYLVDYLSICEDIRFVNDQVFNFQSMYELIK
jgi:Dullard-like phosphatase family protein